MSVSAATQFHQSHLFATSVHIDSDLTMRSRIIATVRSCFVALCQIRSVQRSLDASNHAVSSPCSGCQRSWLLQLCPDWRLCAPFGQTTVRAECHCPSDLPGKEVRTHRPITPRTPLVACSGENPIPAVCSGISLPSRHSAVIHCWQSTPMSTVVVTSAWPTQCRWSFHQLCARHSATAPFPWLWPEHGMTIRASPSLLMFHQQLKTFKPSFQSTFHWLNNDGFYWTELTV